MVTATQTEELGTVYTLSESDSWRSDGRAEIGRKITLSSTWVSYGGARFRSWYLHGDKGVISFSGHPDATLACCERWLERNGYEVQGQGQLPPEAFEYVRPYVA